MTINLVVDNNASGGDTEGDAEVEVEVEVEAEAMPDKLTVSSLFISVQM